MSGYCTDIVCPYAKIFKLQNRNMECYCVPDNEEDEHKLKDNWKKYGMKKEIEFFCSVNGCAIEGISQKLNLSRNTVYMWHQGKSFPNVKQLAAFMDLCEIGAIIP